MFYELYEEQEYDNILRPYVKEIEEACLKSEFQFLEKKELYWEIPSKENFVFKEFYYVNKRVPVFNFQAWEKATSILDTDGFFQIPIVINYHGERHYYNIVVPPRIRCLDSKGQLMAKNVGRYQIFKSQLLNDDTIYISQQLYEKLKIFPAIKIKGVE